VEALNELCAKGVTRENNLAIPLLEAMGRGQGAKAAAAIWRERAALGLRGDGGESFVPLREFAQENWREGDGGSPDEAEDRPYALTTKGPWTAVQSPLAARWLEAVRKRLDTVVVGSARDRFYFPMVSAQEPATLIKVITRISMRFDSWPTRSRRGHCCDWAKRILTGIGGIRLR
jgi:hypothetical protein